MTQMIFRVNVNDETKGINLKEKLQMSTSDIPLRSERGPTSFVRQIGRRNLLFRTHLC